MSAPVWRLLRSAPLAVAIALSACTIPAGKLGEPQTLHTGEVVQVLTRSEILASGGIHGALNNSGVSDGAIADGSVVIIRLMCCGPPNTANPHGALNAQLLPIKVGDVVEFIWSGASAVNSVTRVVQSADQAKAGDAAQECWWDPKNENLWRRVMYCEWMPSEGWVKQDGLTPGWYKPPGPH